MSVVALLLLSACSRGSDAPAAGSSEGSAPRATVQAAAVETAPGEAQAALSSCERLRLELSGIPQTDGETVDAAALSARLANVEGPGWQLAVAEARGVGTSEPVAAAFRARISAADDATLRPVLRGLMFADRLGLVATAQTMVGDSTLAIPSRYVAADALASAGADGIDALASLLSAQTGDDLDRIVTAGLRGALENPIAAREVLFDVDGVCVSLERPVCRRLARRLLPVDGELAARITNLGPNGALIGAQFAAERDESELSAWVQAASRPDADPVAVMASFSELAPWVDPRPLVGVARALLRDASLESVDRRGIARWMFGNAARIEVGVDVLEGVDDRASLALLAGAAIASSGAELPADVVATIGAMVTGTSVDARFAALVMAAATGRVPDGANDADRPMLEQVARRDVTGIVSAGYATALALDAALLAGRGDDEALAAALAAAPASAQTLRLAAAASEPDATLAARLEPVLSEVLSAQTGRWMAASARSEAVGAAAATTLSQPPGPSTMGALEAARAAREPVARDVLEQLLTSQSGSLWVEPLGLRELAAELAVGHDSFTPDDVLRMRAQTAPSGVGADSVGLLGLAVLARCETP